MKKASIITVIVMAVTMATATIAQAQGPTCAEGLGIENHGQHVIGDYVKGEARDARGGVILPGGPAAHGHFLNPESAGGPIAPGASFCTNSSSPGIHPLAPTP